MDVKYIANLIEQEDMEQLASYLVMCVMTNDKEKATNILSFALTLAKNFNTLKKATEESTLGKF